MLKNIANLPLMLSKKLPLILWLLIGLTYVLIVFGSAVRVTDSGMACPDWPLCYGQWLPFPEPASGYIVDGQHYTWWQVSLEWGHRLLAAVVSFLLLGVAVAAVVWRKQYPQLVKWVWLPLVILAVQIKLGGLTVFLSNIHWSVALHLGGAVLVLSSLLWLVRPQAAPALPKLAWWGLAAFAVAVFITMLMGAMVSAGHFGGVCGGLWVCLGSIWPDDFGQQFHMKHRFMAVISLILCVIWVVLIKRTAPGWRFPMLLVKSILAVQVLLGIITLYSFTHYPQFYPLLSVSHLAVAVLLFSASWAALIGVLGPRK